LVVVEQQVLLALLVQQVDLAVGFEQILVVYYLSTVGVVDLVERSWTCPGGGGGGGGATAVQLLQQQAVQVDFPELLLTTLCRRSNWFNRWSRI
jgi:hypothetical protein